jgi:diaminopimelate dehydrogenase
MSRLRLAIVGHGRLGRACAQAISAAADVELIGVVRHQTPVALNPLGQIPVAGHVRELGSVDAALVCVPTEWALGVARELLQDRVPIVECARLEGRAQQQHYENLDTAAHRYRVPAIVGAGWDPGVLPVLRRLFEVLVPHGKTVQTRHPGIALHHSAELDDIAGVKEALAGEVRDAQGNLRRYVYVELAKNGNIDAVRRSIESDPLFAAETTEIFAIPDAAALEATSGLVIERRAEVATAGEHSSLSLDARVDAWRFAARVMLDAARAIPSLPYGAHRYALGPIPVPRASTRA